MTLSTNELFDSFTKRAAKRFHADRTATKTIAAVTLAPILEQLTPMFYDEDAATWKVWTADNEEQTLTFDATGGVYTLAFDGVVSPSLTYANTSGDTATILAALEALPGIQPGDVTVTRGTPVGNVTIFTVVFMGQWASKNVPAIAITETLTGGGSTLVVATTVAGAGSPDIDAFVFEDENGGNPCQTHATLETTHVLMMGGTIHRDDVVLPAGESQSLLDLQLKSGMRAKGFTVQGLVGVH